MAKALANRLQSIIDICLDPIQCAFVPGRLITDNILVAYELLHGFKQKRMGRMGYMTLKLDMAKAYNRVKWSFLRSIMLRMSFDIGWVKLIMRCITSVSYSIFVNGQWGTSFHPSKGLRQGDPLSLFFIVQ